MRLSSQLYHAIGSIGANIAEGYSRQSGRDQARLYEYALGSAREARHWYYQAQIVLHPEIVQHRLQIISTIIRLLLKIIPAQRSRTIAEESIPYTIPDPQPPPYTP